MENNLEYCLKHQERSGRFIEACLLVLLAEKASYGYNLLERLKAFDYNEETINMSIIYRNLRRMEKNNLIKAEWQKSEVGPDQKIYSLTSHGYGVMDLWADFLNNRINQLESIVDKYKQVEKGGS